MDARELRIGNWLDAGFMKVRLLSVDDIPSMEGEDGRKILKNKAIEELKPIPLTLITLAAAGFEKYDSAYMKDDYIIEEQPDGTLNFLMWEKIQGEHYESHAITIKKNIEHIHQLQNLIFAIEDDELNVQIPINQP